MLLSRDEAALCRGYGATSGASAHVDVATGSDHVRRSARVAGESASALLLRGAYCRLTMRRQMTARFMRCALVTRGVRSTLRVLCCFMRFSLFATSMLRYAISCRRQRRVIFAHDDGADDDECRRAYLCHALLLRAICAYAQRARHDADACHCLYVRAVIATLRRCRSLRLFSFLLLLLSLRFRRAGCLQHIRAERAIDYSHAMLSCCHATFAATMILLRCAAMPYASCRAARCYAIAHAD